MAIYKHDGGILKVGGAIAIHEDCCCGGGGGDIDDCCLEWPIDVTFSGISDCGFKTSDCTAPNGNTYTTTYNAGLSSPGSYCVWDVSVGDIYVQVRILYSDSTYSIYVSCSNGGENCFYNDPVEITGCDEIPLTVYNDNVCTTPASNTEGENGSAYIEWS